MNYYGDANEISDRAQSGMYCLVAEDNAFALDIMGMYLQRFGFCTDGAENGKVALDKYLAAPDRYCAIFMDLQMPVMSGYETAQNIRNSGHNCCTTLPIIAMSGDPLEQLERFGFDKQLKKPFDMHAVEYVLKELSLF